MTAVAVVEPFSDDFLDGLLPLLRHASALGLWQWTVSATSTAAELSILDAAEDLRAHIGEPRIWTQAERRLLLVAEALEKDVSWHSQDRFSVATAIAREFLIGERGPQNEQVLYAQGNEWNEIRLDLRHSLRKAPYFAGVPVSHDWSGRGATTVWRAERAVEIQDLEEWLAGEGQGSSASDGAAMQDAASRRQMTPPNWWIQMPNEWSAIAVSKEAMQNRQILEWVAAGRVLVLPIQGRSVMWPLTRASLLPVPGFESIVKANRTLPKHRLIEFVEAVLIDWVGQPASGEDADDKPILLLPVDKAYEFGYVSADERRQAMAAAREHTLSLPWSRADGERVAQDDIRITDGRFRLLVTRRRTRRVAKAMWIWPGGSVADEVVRLADGDASLGRISWLASSAYRMTRLELFRSMEQTWHDGFDHRPESFWHPGR